MDSSARRATALSVLLFTAFFSAAASESAIPALGLEQYRGQVVLVDFWASWCVPCRRSFPWMNEMQRKYADDGLVIVGINMDAASEDANTFLRDTPAEFRIVYDPDGELARQFEVEAMPSSYVIDRNGNVAAKHLGFRDKMTDDYETKIREVLNVEEN
jgi:cytochrome c biogenesis protein CcmG/thiol:disulfide interchange protein DsbE